MAVSTGKVCVMCGQDVAAKPRTKDAAGNYYCNPCWAKRTRQQVSPSTSPIPSSTVDAGEFEIAPNAVEEFSLADEPRFPDPPVAAPPSAFMQPQSASEGPKRSKMRLILGGVILLTLIGAGIAYYLMPTQHDDYVRKTSTFLIVAKNVRSPTLHDQQYFKKKYDYLDSWYQRAAENLTPKQKSYESWKSITDAMNEYKTLAGMWDTFGSYQSEMQKSAALSAQFTIADMDLQTGVILQQKGR